MRLIDLFCGAGGASRGYVDAGFDVVGVDLEPQKNYPYPFLQMDALKLDNRFLRTFDAIHASPPCQFATPLRHAPNGKAHPNLIPATRALLVATGLPYVIENVEEAHAHLIDPVMLCGTMFGLKGAGHELQRHRLFETNFPVELLACAHRLPVVGIYGDHARCRSSNCPVCPDGGRRTRDFDDLDKAALMREAMGVDWKCTNKEVSQMIPPAYSRYIGAQLFAHLNAGRERRAARFLSRVPFFGAQ